MEELTGVAGGESALLFLDLGDLFFDLGKRQRFDFFAPGTRGRLGRGRRRSRLLRSRGSPGFFVSVDLFSHRYFLSDSSANYGKNNSAPITYQIFPLRGKRLAIVKGILYSQAAVYVLYSILLGLALFAYLPFYAVRMKISRKGRVFLKERLGFRPPGPGAGKDSLWIHAVSVGEVLSLQNLVKDLKAAHPEWDIYFSSLTDAGIRQAENKLGSSARVFVVPLDFAGCVRRILRAVRPGVLVLAESEFWPNLLREASRATRGIILVNGRISERSFCRFRRFRSLAKKLLGRVEVFLVQTAEDKERLEKLGIDPGRIRVSGNLKCETRLPSFRAEDLGRMKDALGIGARSMVVVAGSTHKGEEEQLLEALYKARSRNADLRLILAPRHIERTADLEKMARGMGFRVERRTQAGRGAPWDVLLLDTIGELACIYAISDLAFIGGSLVDWGGQNLLEPAYYGRPICFGPHMNNFSHLAEIFVRNGAAKIVRNVEELETIMRLDGARELEEMGNRAKAMLGALSGATDMTVKAIEALMAGDRG